MGAPLIVLVLSLALLLSGAVHPSSAAAQQDAGCASFGSSFAAQSIEVNGGAVRLGCARDAGDLRLLANSDSDFVATIDINVSEQPQIWHQAIDHVVDATRADMQRGVSLSEALALRIKRANVGFYRLTETPGFGGSIHAVGDSLVIVVPRADIGTAGFWDGFWKGVVIFLGSTAAAVLSTGLCLTAFPEALLVCGAVGGAVAGPTGEILSFKLDNPQTPIPAEVWGKAAGLAIAGAVLGVGVGSVVKWMETGIPAMMTAVRATLVRLAARYANWRTPIEAVVNALNSNIIKIIVETYSRRVGTTDIPNDPPPPGDDTPNGPQPPPGGANPTAPGLWLALLGRPLRVMVVGDSMTQGREGDWTWRFRLWEWFRSQGIDVDFVGPYRGTHTPNAPEPPSVPRLQGEPDPPSAPPRTTGGYADFQGSFDDNHFAVWGRQAAQSKTLIREQVALHQPDLLLAGLGFNDMGWWVSGPDGTLGSMKTLVDEARLAKPNLRFAVANVPHRTFIPGREDLVANTDVYNRMLAATLPSWSTTSSPVALVDWEGAYVCDPAWCPAGYDGLHPNAQGEHQIAGAFAQTLHRAFGIGGNLPGNPGVTPLRDTPIPSNVVARSSPHGITVTWDPVYGAHGYRIRSRIRGVTDWSELPASTTRYDTTWTADGLEWEYQVLTDNGQQKSPWSGIVSAVARPQTAPPPSRIVTRATATGVDVSWIPPAGAHTDTIHRYEVIILDRDTPGVFLESTAVRGSSVHIDGLRPGHRYAIAVISWNATGGGLPGGGPPVTIGAGTPPAPSGLTVTSIDALTVELRWNGSPQAAGYRVWTRNIASDQWAPDQGIYQGDSARVTWLFPGTWNYEFCLTAVNGETESGRSNCVVAPRPAGS